MTPLQRAAKALYALEPEKGDRFARDCTKAGEFPTHAEFVVPWEEAAEERRLKHLAEARAVLSAVREPSEGMTKAGHDAAHGDAPAGHYGTPVWQAMIDRLISFLIGAAAAFLIWAAFALFGDATSFARPIFWSIGCSLLAISAASYRRTRRLP